MYVAYRRKFEVKSTDIRDAVVEVGSSLAATGTD